MAVSLSSSRLPIELTNIIIGFLHDSKLTLKTTALVCHDWLPESRHHLFYHISLKQHHIDSFLELCQSPLVTFSPSVKKFKIALPSTLYTEQGGFDKLLCWSAPGSSTGQRERCLETAIPRVTTLTLHCVSFSTLGDQSRYNLFSPSGLWKNTLTRLQLLTVEFRDADEFFALVSSFPLLQRLEMRRPALVLEERIQRIRPLPSNLREIVLENVHHSAFIEALGSCTTVSNLRCSFYDYSDATHDKVTAIGQILRSAKLALKKFTFMIDAPGSSNQDLADSVFEHLDLSQNENLESINLVISDGQFLIPFLTRLAAQFNPVVDIPSLKSLDIRFLNEFTLDWGELDSILQTPYFSSLRELKCTIEMYYALNDTQGPGGPAEGSGTRLKMQSKVEMLRQRLPQCAGRGILHPRRLYMNFWA